jgi:undecaprenyl diphosphate synthase
MAFDFARQSPLHVAIIPDGNGRWAAARGLPRTAGHRAGVEAVRRTVRAAAPLGIGTLTFHALSCGNWQRPEGEVRAILDCIAEFLESETPACLAHGVRVSVIGARNRLPAELLRAVEAAEGATARGRTLELRLALDYSSRSAIAAALATAMLAQRTAGHEALRALACDVDLLVRSGGEQRLGDFLLWESAYAELVFVPKPWPDFGAEDLAAAVAEFHRRERRFGGLPARGEALASSPRRAP